MIPVVTCFCVVALYIKYVKMTVKALITLLLLTIFKISLFHIDCIYI